MDRKGLVCLMASYNKWMNANVYAAAQTLSEDELLADRGAFFGSILKTLNHLVVADTIWLKRFAGHPAKYSVLEPMLQIPAPDTIADLDKFKDLPSIAVHRTWLDRLISDWAQTIGDSDLDFVMTYTNSRGGVTGKDFFGLVMHFFNHQTHHRGQITTLLSQSAADVGVTDLLALVPNGSGA
ncbi:MULTISPECIES: DinB family protein [unclassified Lysobacter]|uniref:DinB family protein n=1 Tax=unclassified Lysobacter TaxID=2635362 RepID=UPI0006F3304B|nr:MULTISPECIES: DinB family protein [unclassified Lysobacter]KQZ57856.1 diguanylate cyclase [Lysobacter sp. Root559]KRC34008.1 diguanylate cyclase [Lysobacter sp. Root76]KRD69342.1 diguanylate cyclase [Lysobacter sp. Root96]